MRNLSEALDWNSFHSWFSLRRACVCVCVCVLFVCHLLEELQEAARSHGEFMPTKDISQSFAVAELQKFSLSHFVRNLRNGEIQESRFPRFSERVTRAQQRSVVICTVHSLWSSVQFFHILSRNLEELESKETANWFDIVRGYRWFVFSVVE